MPATKPPQPNKQNNLDRPAGVQPSGRVNQVSSNPTTSLPVRPRDNQREFLAATKQSQLAKLILADAIHFDRGDLYIVVHRAIKPGILENVRFSLYSCEKDKSTGVRWAVKGRGQNMGVNHDSMSPNDVLNVKGTATLKLCFAVVIKQNISSRIKQSSPSTVALGEPTAKSDWEGIAQIITEDDTEIQSLPVTNSFDYVRVTVKRLEKAGIIKFRDESRFWEEIEKAEEIFAHGNVGPLPDRILMSRHILY